MRPLAFDTETINRPGHGEAILLLAEKPGGGVEYVERPENFLQIFNFLNGGRYVAFNADFDIRAIIHPKFIPEKTLDQLARYDCGIFGRFKFHLIPGKYFKCWVSGVGGFEIFDIKSFFQGHSLDSASETYLKGTRKIDFVDSIKKIKKMKQQGDHLKEYIYSRMDKWLSDSATREATLEYGIRDVEVLSELYDVLAGSFEAAGIPDPSLYSPGSAAMEIFGPMLKAQMPGDDQNEYFRRSYFGGRVEVAEMGKITGPLNYYDIKSAYPFEASNLPDLTTAAYREGKGNEYIDREDVKAGCYEISVDIPDSWHYGPFPKRSAEGKIYFPVGMFRTYIGRAGFELVKEFKIPYYLYSFAEFYGGSPTLPFFDKITELFKLRSDPQKSLAVKLILNSFYGKTAESTNHNQVLPPELKEFQRLFNSERLYGKYTNFPYASFITERVRLRLWRAAMEQGAVLMATDGIITRGNLKTGKNLGDWDLKGKLSRAYILGCGRYEIEYSTPQKNKKGEQWTTEYHFRGFRGAAAIFKKLKNWAGHKMPEFILDGKSLKQWAIGLNKADFNVLTRLKKDIIISDDKRFWQGHKIKSVRGWFKTRQLSLPLREN